MTPDAERMLPPRAEAPLPSGGTWAADIIPVLRPDAADPTARHAVVLVMAGDRIVWSEYGRHPGADYADRMIADAIAAGIRDHGVSPTTIAVRGRRIAASVQAQLANAGVSGVMVDGYDSFDDAELPFDGYAHDLRRHFDGDGVAKIPISASPRWEAWGVHPDDVAEFFRALATLVRAASARGFRADIGNQAGDGGMVVSINGLGGDESMAMVTGRGTRLLDVTFYDDPDDWGTMVEAGRLDPRAVAVRYTVTAITFVEADDLPHPGSAGEFAARGWELAGPDAYPWMWILNAEGGGLDTVLLRSLTRRVTVLAATIAHASAPIAAELPLHYIDQTTGTMVTSLAT